MYNQNTFYRLIKLCTGLYVFGEFDFKGNFSVVLYSRENI